jgi:ATP-dependent DNA helicase RecQ
MVHYAESASCRRQVLLEYFGEICAEDNCEGCDNCLSPRETYDGTLDAQKFLSCIYRVRQQSGFDFGVNQIAEVLTGADTENVRKWDHGKISTYSIGREHSRSEWKAIGRQLVRLGYVKQAADKFNVLSLTAAGLDLLKQRQRVTLSKPVSAPEPVVHKVGEVACDEGLFESLRQLRKRIADQQGVPPYIVFSDVSLRQMARQYPTTELEFSRISGVGERKLKEFGSAFLGEIVAHLQSSPRQIFAEDSFAAPVSGRSRLGTAARETLRRFRAGESIEGIAQARNVAVSTIYGHLADALQAGEQIDLGQFLTPEQQREIAAAFDQTGSKALSPVFDLLGGRYDYGRLKLVRAAQMRGP